MSTELSPYVFDDAAVRAGIDETGEPWFAASDVARILGHRDAEKMTRALDDDERGTRLVGTPGGEQRMVVITEAGLYTAILTRQTGRIEDAQTRDRIARFKRFVTHDVLPAIRKTGAYSVTVTEPAPVLPTPRELAVMLIAAEDAREAAEARVAELEPKADLADTYLIADGSSRKVREVAKLLRMRERDLRRFLVDERLLFVRHARCGDAQYDFYAEFAHHFTAKETVVNHTFGTCSHYTIYVTARGIDLIRRRMAKVALPADEAARQLAEVTA